MLHQHAFHRLFRKVGIYGLATKGIEVLEAVDKGGIEAALLVDGFLDSGGEFGDALGKVADGGFPLLNMGCFVVEELVDDLDKGFGAGDVFVE
jgi:hypothetical protein